MESYVDYFKGKKITVLGLGLLGRGVGDVGFLAQCGAQVLVTDKKSEAELAESVAKLKKYPHITFRLGGHHKEDFEKCDLVIKSAGVRLDSPEIATARAAGVPVTMSTALFAKYAMASGARIIGVTGTRGKTTVAHMIYSTLRETGGWRVHLGGNVRGISTLAMLPIVKKDDVVVLELDSWQLQGFGDLQISPNIAVFTNLMSDHQNYYKTVDEYFADKANAFLYQKPGDTLIVGKMIAPRIRDMHPPVDPVVPRPLPDDWKLEVLGEHNRENAALAAAALFALGLTADKIREGLATFEGVEGRLQFVREVNGIQIYNDNNATTPEATIAAIEALDTGKKNIILIMGGSDKGLNMTELVAEIKKTCKSVLLLAGTGTDRIKDELGTDMIYHIIDDAVKAALEIAEKGDAILFSPAFASFGMFKNEYDRNDHFMLLARAL